MATLDEILGGSPQSGGSGAPKGSLEWAGQNSGDNAPVTSPATPSPTKAKPEQAKPEPISTGGDASGGGGGGYEELYKKLNPYTPPTAEELEKERKREKRAQIFAAIGDGITALSNLFFTTQYAPSMYNGKNTLSDANKVRYDKLLKDREEKKTAYFNGLMKAKQADDEAAKRSRQAADSERSWQRQLGLDQEARDRYNEGIKHRNERERIEDERYKNEQEYKRGRDEESDKRWEENFKEERRQANRNYNLKVKQHNDDVAVRREQVAANRARGVRGKQLGFADGNGNQVSIYENVWKASMQQVYDAMLQDLAPADENERNSWERQMKKLDTPQKKEDYVKQNWHKSQKASALMRTLSKIDPAKMTSENGLGWGNTNSISNETDW